MPATVLTVRDMPASPQQPLRDLDTLSREELIALVVHSHEVIIALQEEMERLKRGGQRQAAPFSKKNRKPNPKKPGRKPRGSGSESEPSSDNFAYRDAPTSEEITEPVVEVPLEQTSCPSCGGALGEVHEEMAYKTSLPKNIQPTVTAYRVQVCHCQECGKSVRGSHPDVAPDQYGATAHRMDDTVMAAAHILHMAMGVPVRKVPAVLDLLNRILLTQSAITQDMLRRTRPPSTYPDGEVVPAGTVWRANQQLRVEIKQEKSIHTDDTGWSINGDNAFLMGFETPITSVFQIRYQHRNEEVREVIPSDYSGTMVTDRGKSYDAVEYDAVNQQKCISHAQSNLKEALRKKEQQAQGPEQMQFCLDLKELLKRAVGLWRLERAGKAPTFKEEAAVITAEMTYLLRDREMQDPDDQRLLNGLGWHHDRGNLLRFLKDPEIEPTNNRAERGLRPAVIARKVSQCSKNTAGADAYAAFASVINTLKKRITTPLIDAVCEVFRTGHVPCASP
jgi:transposase